MFASLALNKWGGANVSERLVYRGGLGWGKRYQHGGGVNSIGEGLGRG